MSAIERVAAAKAACEAKIEAHMQERLVTLYDDVQKAAVAASMTRAAQVCQIMIGDCVIILAPVQLKAALLGSVEDAG